MSAHPSRAYPDAAEVGARADELLARIWPILAGHSRELQGAVVADLAAAWVAGHRARGRAEGDQFRAELLGLHAQHVRELVELYLGDADG